jgi:AraC-like DNA-binding protein/transposase-like protein
MHRRRQVRLRYPQAFVQLSIALALRHGSHRAARALGLPLSTLYRWRDAARRQPSAPGDAALAEWIGACSAHGFDLRERVASLEPQVTRSVVPPPPPPSAAGMAANGSARRFAPPLADNPPRAAGSPLAPGIRARVQVAREAIEQRYYAPLSCEQLAALAGMSRFHFIRTFKNAFGVAPYRYLLQMRIRHAKALLSTTPQPLDTVAAAVGFDSPSLLMKAFRNIEGISLANYFRGVRLGARPPAAAALQAPAAAPAGP